jgi:phosphomannomutase/phosphoglucomutase
MSNIPKEIFRAYDIRGIASQVIGDKGHRTVQITPELAELLGRAYATLLTQEIGKAPRVVVGHDNRLTGETLTAALIEGLLTAGAAVTDIGHATSPYLYFATCYGQFDGGINVTGSHNPAEYNGFKMTRSGAAPIAGEEIQKLYELIKAGKFDFGQGELARVELRQDYFDKLNQLAPIKRKLKIVLDCGNGTAGYFAPEFFRAAGHELVELYCEPDGRFPNHLPNPEEVESLRDLQAKVLESGADLGLAWDGDGDRVGVVDERGEIISPDRLIVLLARDLLIRQPGAEVIFDVKCSSILPAEITKAGGKSTRWKTGHSFIKQKMRETGALLAGEVSGHIFFAEDYYGVDDGLLAAAKVVSILAGSSQPLSSHFADLSETFTTPELKAPVADAVKFQIMENIKTSLLKDYAGDTLDGVRVELPDGWFLIRPSNTSPYLTVRCEADSAEKLTEIKKIVAIELKQYPEVDASAISA